MHRQLSNKSQSSRQRTATTHALINGWQFDRKVHVTKGLSESYYRNPTTNWTARELHQGPNNRFIGLLLIDDKGKSRGTVRSVLELP